MKEVLLYSGGMDSYIAWHYLKKPQTLYVPLNHKYVNNESKAIRQTIPSTIISSPFDFAHLEKADAEIPLRNMYLVMYAVNMGYDKIHLITQKDETAMADRSQAFMDKASKLLSVLAEKPIEVSSPFMELDKFGMVSWYKDNGLPILELLKTWACHQPTDQGDACMNCPACFRREISLEFSGIHSSKRLTDSIVRSYLYKLSNYSEDRQNHTLHALKKGQYI